MFPSSRFLLDAAFEPTDDLRRNGYVAKPIVDQNALVELVRRHISSSGALDGGSTVDTGCNGKA